MLGWWVGGACVSVYVGVGVGVRGNVGSGVHLCDCFFAIIVCVVKLDDGKQCEIS